MKLFRHRIPLCNSENWKVVLLFFPGKFVAKLSDGTHLPDL